VTPQRRRRRRAGSSRRGQGLVEFALALPVFTLVLLGLLDCGLLFAHVLGLQFATREGARVGAGLASGTRNAVTWPQVCGEVDAQVVAAIERTMRDRGSLVDIDEVTQIQITKVRADGTADPAAINTWTYTGTHTGPTVDGTTLSFSPPGTPAWNACNRLNGVTPDAIGVWITYRYRPSTFVGQTLGAISGALTVTDHSVFVLNP
jgi:Flp pilus assembly protein TadG